MSRYRTLAFKSLAGLALIRGSASDQIESNGWFVLLSLYGHLSLQCTFSKSSESPNDNISSILTRTSIIFCCSSLKAVSNWKLIGKHQKSLFIYYSLISVWGRSRWALQIKTRCFRYQFDQLSGCLVRTQVLHLHLGSRCKTICYSPDVLNEGHLLS